MSAAVLAAPGRYKSIGGQDRHVRGWRPEAEDHRVSKIMTVPNPSWPRAVRNKWVAIKDQGQVGDCTANGTCEAAEVLGAPPLSRLYLYYYTRALEGTPANEDSGATVGSALATLAARGCPPEVEWDYSDAEVRFAIPPPAKLDPDANQHKAVLYYRCPDLSTLIGAIVAGHPCVFGFKCPENMFGTDCMKTGKVIYPDATEGFEGGHCTGIAGFDLDMQLGNDKGALVLPNSWGTSVGDYGYFYLPTRFVDDGLAGSIYALVEVML